MIEPSLEDLLKEVDSKFSLITMVSKRARQLNSGFTRLVKSSSTKPVTVAMEEIAQGKIKYTRKKAKE
jgi:DNA-directed RNA polymerase subunit omega